MQCDGSLPNPISYNNKGIYCQWWNLGTLRLVHKLKFTAYRHNRNRLGGVFKYVTLYVFLFHIHLAIFAWRELQNFCIFLCLHCLHYKSLCFLIPCHGLYLSNILSKFQLSSCSGLGLPVFWIYFHKPSLTYLLN